MAGIGAAPKDPSQRRTRRAPARGEWTDINPIDKPALPPLPRDNREYEWSPLARECWNAWRNDPVSALWDDVDLMYAKIAIRMISDGKAHTAEVRHRLNELGLTPKGKRDLRWRTPGQPGTPGFTQPVKKTAAPKRNAERQARLSVVE